MTDEITSDQAAAVFRRAAELDLRRSAPKGRELDLAALEQAGLEAGLSRDAIRQAVAEVKAGTLEPKRQLVVVSRTLNIGESELEKAVAAFMRQQNCRLMRRLEDRVIWTPDRSFFGGVRRMTDFSRKIVLREVGEVTTCVVGIPGEPGRSHVRFEIDMARIRRGWNALPMALGAAGIAGASVAAALEPSALIAIVPGATAAVGGGFAGARAGYRSSVRRNATAVERFLDLLERGD